MNQMKKQLVLLTVLCLYLVSLQTNAVAYCALRDPKASIKNFFPNFTHYQSVVRTVDIDAREAIREQLKGISLHYGELGRHTLYEIYETNKLLGYVHVRSEQSRWGLVEIAWALSPHLTILDYDFQRIRSPKKQLLLNNKAKELFIGKDSEMLKKLWSPEDEAPNAFYLNTFKGAEDISETLLRCALKTIMVTKYAWHDVLQEEYIPNRDVKLLPITLKLSHEKILDVEQKTGLLLNGVKLYEIITQHPQETKWQVNVAINVDNKKIPSIWQFTKKGEIASIKLQQVTQSNLLRQLFSELVGKTFDANTTCSNSAELVAQALWVNIKQ